MAWFFTIVLSLLAIGSVVVLLKAFRQNRNVWSEIRQARRPVRTLLRDTLVLWSPLALVIFVFAFAANRLAAGAVSLSYRLTTLDEFCSMRDVAGNPVIPCTGMDATIAQGAIRRAGPVADSERFVSGKYRQAREQFLASAPDELKQSVTNRAAFYRSLSPGAVLGLEVSPEDDHELVRLKRELRELLRTPTAASRDVLDYLRFVTERDARLRRMRELTARVRARREFVNERAYAGLPRDAQGRLWLRHRLSHLLAQATAHPESATEAALGNWLAGGGSAAQNLLEVRQVVVNSLAKDEAVVAGLLARESSARTGPAALAIALEMPRLCTVAVVDEQLRPSAGDFADEAAAVLDPDRLLQSNSGTFPCFDMASAAQSLRIESLGFRESVHRSIDRWQDDIAGTSFRRLGQLGLRALATQDDAKVAARDLALTVPAGIQLGRADCGFLHPGNCAANAANMAAEAGYAKARADLEAGYERRAEAATSTATVSVDQRIGQVLVDLDPQLAGMRSSAHEYVDRLFLVSDLFRIVGWLALALVTVKSFLYVLALELFHSDEDMAVAFESADPVEGDYRTGRQVTIDRDFPYPLITRKQLSNTDNNVRIAPWPWSSPISRILRGRYFVFTRGSFLADAESPAASTASQRGMVASAGGGLSIVEWRMKPGEEVIFRYKDFYGASENVELHSEMSFRLSTLLLGRIIFHSARCTTGEGRLLLRANVEDNEQEDIRAIPPERMIAWNRHAQFTIHSGRTPWKTMLNGYTLVRRSRPGGRSGRVVVSSDDAGSNFGSIRFLRRIFSAIF